MTLLRLLHHLQQQLLHGRGHLQVAVAVGTVAGLLARRHARDGERAGVGLRREAGERHRRVADRLTERRDVLGQQRRLGARHRQRLRVHRDDDQKVTPRPLVRARAGLRHRGAVLAIVDADGVEIRRSRRAPGHALAILDLHVHPLAAFGIEEGDGGAVSNTVEPPGAQVVAYVGLAVSSPTSPTKVVRIVDDTKEAASTTVSD